MKNVIIALSIILLLGLGGLYFGLKITYENKSVDLTEAALYGLVSMNSINTYTKLIK